MTVENNMGPSFVGPVHLQDWAQANGCPWNFALRKGIFIDTSLIYWG